MGTPPAAYGGCRGPCNDPGARWLPEAGRGDAPPGAVAWLLRAAPPTSGGRSVVFCLADCWMSWKRGTAARRGGASRRALVRRGIEQLAQSAAGGWCPPHPRAAPMAPPDTKGLKKPRGPPATLTKRRGRNHAFIDPYAATAIAPVMASSAHAQEAQPAEADHRHRARDHSRCRRCRRDRRRRDHARGASRPLAALTREVGGRVASGRAEQSLAAHSRLPRLFRLAASGTGAGPRRLSRRRTASTAVRRNVQIELITEAAIRRVTLLDANPVYGLNRWAARW